MKIVQLVGGSAAEMDLYVGAEREITVDLDNWDLRLHDGVTAGGRLLINRDNGDERWQGHSVELDGFTFLPEARGQVTRLSAGNYKIRQLTVDGDSLNVTNADGYNANPLIALNSTVIGDRTFDGDIQVTGVMAVTGGINADTSGTHFGPTVGAVTGDVTGNVTGNLTGNSTGTHTGDVNVSGHTLTLDDGQIPVTKIGGLLDYILANAFSGGVITIWSGAVDDVPDGWYLCNGLNGTPDLTDKFVVGAGGVGYDPGDQGGAASHSHAVSMSAAGDHTHTLTVAAHALTVAELPAHKHANGVTDAQTSEVFSRGSTAAAATTPNSIDANSDDGIYEGWTETVGSGDGHTHAGTAATAGSHTHTLDNPSADSRPPYYALCYIMRVIA